MNEDQDDEREVFVGLDFDPFLENKKPKPVDVGGRPRLDIDLSKEEYMKPLKELCKIQCTVQECADFFDVSIDTLQRRLKDIDYEGFAAFFKIHSSPGKRSLRRLQWHSANKGNVTMQIWLGKNMLGQTDKVESWNSENEKFDDDDSLKIDNDPA